MAQRFGVQWLFGGVTLELDPADDTDALPHIMGSSISYRVAVGAQQGQKAFMIRTIGPLDRSDPGLERMARANWVSLYLGECPFEDEGGL